MNNVKSLLIRTDVTCVKCCNNYIFAGIGDKLYIFERTKNINIIKIFDGGQIFGIVFNNSLTECLVYGENKIAVLACNFLDNNFEIISLLCMDDWILSAIWIDMDQHIVTVSMHNIVYLWSKDFKLIDQKLCEENCILYSSHLVNVIWEEVIVLSGTVFSQILIWWPYKSKEDKRCPVLVTLNGHKGVIFSMDCNQRVGMICSTSDDRSAIFWSIPNKNLITELMQPEINVSMKCSLYAHAARVFRCLVLDECVLTAGEDSLVNVWDFEGNLIKKLEVHSGASVWDLDYDCGNGNIVTAGGDCGVTLLPLNDNIEKREIEIANNYILKKVGTLNDENLVGIAENGMILHYRASLKEWLEVKQHNDLFSYALLDVWKSTNSVALAGYHGTVHIYNQYSNQLIHVCSNESANKSRIFSLHWLSENNILTCEAEGVLCIWLIKYKSVVPEFHLRLPPSKEQWTTCACMCGQKLIAVGDRKGNIYIYTLQNIEPIQVIKKAHNYLGITNLHFRNGYLTSLGRNSLIKKYKFDQSIQQFLHLSSDKVPFTWTAAVYDDDQFTLLFAFLGKQFVVWDYNNRRTLLQFDCGGAHRSWDFCKLTDTVQFVFIKNKKVCVVKTDMNLFKTLHVMEGFHSSEINNALCLKLTNTTKYVLISGGEDTTIRLSEIDWGIIPVKLKTINIFKSHLSSVRAITACSIESDSSYDRYLIFSAGGRAQIILWELEINRNNNYLNCSEKFSHYEALSSDESETRVMDLCCISTTNAVILIAASSNGSLRIFLVYNNENKNSYKMSAVGEFYFKSKCILKIKHFKVQNQDIVLSCCTQGNVTFWDFTRFILSVENSKNIQHCTPKCLEEIPTSIELHSGGINSVDCKIVDSNRCLLLTGGDDNVINYTLISFSIKNCKLDVEVLSKFCNSVLHCAQITGVFIASKYFFTISIDHKLNVFKWFLNDNDIICEYYFKYNSSIADIQGMQCFENSFGVHTVIYGRGLELYEVSLK
ncbi:hypothetical protein RI129_001129 [Pyrocoelia pectoralis]|uniref:tRNA (34-2'-O)-methyltransferase regulator WDR6 n=1 Tax=Pyrocoelia pectoralis TaxID=417401 RepID=A0AAN7VM68_9COLE